jgi:hypothetical protein
MTQSFRKGNTLLILVVGQMCGAFRRGATADFSPAFQGRDQIADWSRRVATIEKTSSFRRRYATQTESSTDPGLKGRAKVSRRSRDEKHHTFIPRP